MEKPNEKLNFEDITFDEVVGDGLDIAEPEKAETTKETPTEKVEEESEITQQLGARALPYMVFISKSGEIQPQVGALNKDTLKYYFEGLIQKK